ncbi:MAG: SbcC/MukB-like Walker B domain-containing protein [Eubacteriales bacterium]
MRPKLLEIEGLQSFQDIQRIDFDYLGETGLFGIFGPTGSGKSTVLDAITFALYGKVKRADRGTQGIINMNMKQARVSFVFELLKENSRKKYRVERVYKRKKGSEILCEPKVTRLIEVTEVGEIPISDKATEVTRSIEELLGLNHDDFTRAVVLPQNSFQEFLLLDNSKKREMLERIFYLEEYGKQLLDKIHRKIGKLKSQIDNYEGQLQGYSDADNGALKEAKKNVEVMEAERKNAEDAFKKLEKKYTESKIVWELVQDLEVFLQQEKDFNEKQQEMQVKQDELNKAIKADGLKYLIHQEKSIKQKQKEIKEALESTIKDLEKIIGKLEKAKQKYEEIKAEGEKEKPILTNKKSKLEDALEIKKELDKILEKYTNLNDGKNKFDSEMVEKKAEYTSNNQQKEQFEKQLKEIKETIRTLHTDPSYRQQLQENIILEKNEEILNTEYKSLCIKLKETRKQCEELEKKSEKMQDEIVSIKKEITVLNNENNALNEKKPQDRETVHKISNQSNELKGQLQILQMRKTDLEDINNKINDVKQILNSKQAEKQDLDKKTTELKQIYEERKGDYETAIKKLEQNSAYLLSKKLQEGMPCPVCGSEHHPKLAAHTEDNNLKLLEQQVDKTKNKMEEAEKEYQGMEQESVKIQEQISSLIDYKNEYRKDYRIKEIAFEEEYSKLPKDIKGHTLEEISQVINKLEKEYVQSIQVLKDWEDKDTDINEKIQNHKELLNEHLLKSKEIAAQLNSKQEYYGQIAKEVDNSKIKLNENHNAYLLFIDEYKIKSIAAELKQIAEKDHQSSTLQKKVDVMENDISQKGSELEEINRSINKINGEILQRVTQINTIKESRDEKQLKIKELAGNMRIEDEIQFIDKKLKEYDSSEKLYEEELKKLELNHQEQESKKNDLLNQQQFYMETHKRHQQELKTSLEEKQFTTINEVEEAFLSKESQKLLDTEISQYNQIGINISANKVNLLKKLNKRSVTEDEWIRINVDFQQIQEQRQTCISNSEVAKTEYERIKTKHEKWVSLNKTYTSITNKHDLVFQIQKLLRGEKGKDNSFIDYVAEERLRYVAAKASETLGHMTKYKYGLELDTDVGFVIRDYTNGGVHRMVTSLSGGETFLTSLSLALALSEEIQLKGQSPLEFFFLDEGFGTLDNQLLDTVMDALERLSNQERIIGLISHVPELKSRLGRRLIIDPPTSQGQGSQVRVEKA